MAYIYRYHLRNKQKRAEIDLSKHKQHITNVINVLFRGILKDSYVSNDYFEFKLYRSVSVFYLQEMGRRLFSEFQETYGMYSGFIRMPQKWYAFLYPSGDMEIMDMDDTEKLISEHANGEFIAKATEYADKFIRQINNEHEIDSFEEKVIHAFYLDVASVSVGDTLNYYFEEGQIITLLEITGTHIRTRYEETVKLPQLEFRNELNADAAYIFNREPSDISIAFDYLKVTQINRIRNAEEVIRRIEDALGISFSKADDIQALHNIAGHKLEFTVHNVGQGLSTSLKYDGESNPFIFFDFGIAEGTNKSTRPHNVTGNVNTNATIILSHIHADHWCRLTEEPNAFKCKWFIPTQKPTLTLNHKYSEIILSGGSVNVVKQTFNFNGGSLFCEGTSKHKPSRVADHEHETGLGLRLEAKNENGQEINILIPGDQQYDYIDNAFLSNIDILVASHHGGKYSWSRRCNVFNDIPLPRNRDSSLIIYSYGMNGSIPNSYNHPSETKDYRLRNWVNVHNTPSDCDYCTMIIV